MANVGGYTIHAYPRPGQGGQGGWCAHAYRDWDAAKIFSTSSGIGLRLVLGLAAHAIEIDRQVPIAHGDEDLRLERERGA